MAQNPSGTTEPSHASSHQRWLLYVIPMAAFLVVSYLESRLTAHYIWVYTGKVALVSLLLFVCRSVWRDIRFEARWLLPAAAAGLAMLAVWVAVSRWVPYAVFGQRITFDPFKQIQSDSQRLFFLGVRLYGLAVMVPVMEELFWRSFLLRYFTDSRWETLPVGTFSVSALCIVSAIFAAMHPEWLAALLYGVVIALLLKQTRSLFACVVMHAVTNLGLGIYVLVTRDWTLW
jgi:CAAX prenyl protease-like protein